MADITRFVKAYQTFRSTFRATSFDSSQGIYLCQDTTQEVIDFDKLLKESFPDSNQRPKSFDAIYVYENNVFLIEFKNQKPSGIDNSEVQKKLEEGVEELFKLLSQQNIQKRDYSFIYCVVYRNCKEPYERYKCGIAKEKVLFGLQQYEQNGFVKKVYTNNVDFFTKQFKKHFQKELAC